MQKQRLLPLIVVDAESFTAALGSGDYEACLFYLRQAANGADTAALASRLGEALFYEGRRAEAVECARRALQSETPSRQTLDCCAWLFSNCGHHAEAACLYERLAGHYPDWVEGYRHASSSYAAIGDLDRAIACGRKASDLAPRCFEFALHAGAILLQGGRDAEALDYLDRAAAAEPQHAQAWRLLSAAALGLDRREDALAWALRALVLAPRDRDTMVHAAELLLQAGRSEEAAAVAREAVFAHPGDAVVLRQLSAAEALCERLDDALDAIDRALTVAPETAEYHLHRGSLLFRRGDPEAAAAAFGRAAALDPSSPQAGRSELAAHLASGRLTDALSAGGRLLSVHPDDEDCVEAVLHALNHRLYTLGRGSAEFGERLSKPCQHRPPRPMPGLCAGLRQQVRTIHALIIRETRTRFGDSRLGYGWALLEPILHIALLAIVFSLVMHGRPPLGKQFIIFYYSGLVPYYMFVHTSGGMTYGITGNGALLQLPLVTTFDVILARGLLELLTDLVVAAVLLAGFAAIGLDALPRDLGAPAAALLVSAMFGCGFGFVNAVLNVFFKSWDKIWTHVTRVLYFASGIFYVPAMMPERVRDVLAWNPLLQAVGWFRSGFFPDYEPHWLDRGYLTIAALTALSGGFALERAARRRLSQPL